MLSLLEWLQDNKKWNTESEKKQQLFSSFQLWDVSQSTLQAHRCCFNNNNIIINICDDDNNNNSNNFNYYQKVK